MEVFAQRMRLPTVPVEMVQEALAVISNPDIQKKIMDPTDLYGFISLWDANLPKLRQWLEGNVAPLVWHLSLFKRDMYIHKDPRTRSRIIYILDPGGENVVTRYYDDDKQTLLETESLGRENWVVMNAARYHDVQGIAPGQYRYAITARVHSRLVG